ncbi:MAG: hypothetical protein AAGH90_03620 [Pseudomonadota bacterium]
MMSWRKYGLACMGSVMACAVSSAMTTDTPKFKVDGVIIVWAGDQTGTAPVVSDFIVGQGQSAPDLIAADARTVVTGTLEPTENATAAGGMPFVITNTTSGDINTDTDGDGRITEADAFTPLGLQDITDARVDASRQSSSFYVASNTAFNIDAVSSPPGTFRDFILLNIIRLNLSSTITDTDDGLNFGSSAQAAHTGGPDSGFAAETTLWNLRFAQTLFNGNQRTAASPGSIVDQSIRFDAEYAIRAANLTGYDLSLGTFDFTVEVTYTAYAP